MGSYTWGYASPNICYHCSYPTYNLLVTTLPMNLQAGAGKGRHRPKQTPSWELSIVSRGCVATVGREP